MHLSVVIPAYNEAKKIARDIEAVSTYLEAQPYDSEVLFVDDGSQDGTRESIESCFKGLSASRVRFRLLSYGENRGKGYAVRYGIVRAKGKYVGFADSGLCVPFSYIAKALEKLDEGFDFAIASRRVSGTKIARQQPLYRRAGSKVFLHLMRAVMGIRVSDTQCGFKFYTAKAANEIFSQVKTDGFMFDVEALMIAGRLGFKGAEFGVEWSNDSDTRYNPIVGTARNMSEILKIRLRLLAQNPERMFHG